MFLGATEWMKKWKKNDWKTSSKETVKNKEEYQMLDACLEDISVDWVSNLISSKTVL